MPVEPTPSRWEFPSPDTADENGVVGVGADLEPGTLLAAYRSGLFPMPIDLGHHIAWWSPDPRGILPLDALLLTRSLRRSCRRFEVRVDSEFTAVIDECRGLRREGAWITPAVRDAYTELHRLGWAHSVETWSNGRLVGGLYGIGVNGLFAGESMFHLETDASKVALVALVSRLAEAGAELLDIQWTTPHLRSLGAIDVRRTDYLERLDAALALPVDAWA